MFTQYDRFSLWVYFWYPDFLRHSWDSRHVQFLADRIHSSFFWKWYLCFLLPLASLFFFPLLFLQLTSFSLSTPGKAIVICFMCIFGLCMYAYVWFIKITLCNILFSAFFAFEMYPCCYMHIKSIVSTSFILSLAVRYKLHIYFSSEDTQISTNSLPPPSNATINILIPCSSYICVRNFLRPYVPKLLSYDICIVWLS